MQMDFYTKNIYLKLIIHKYYGKKKIIFYLIVALTLFVSNTIALKNVFAQNLDISTGKIKNGTSNESQGPGVALQN